MDTIGFVRENKKVIGTIAKGLGAIVAIVGAFGLVRGRPKKEEVKLYSAHCRLTLSEKEKLDNCRTKYNVTVNDILKLGMDYLKILNEILEDSTQ